MSKTAKKRFTVDVIVENGNFLVKPVKMRTGAKTPDIGSVTIDDGIDPFDRYYLLYANPEYQEMCIIGTTEKKSDAISVRWSLLKELSEYALINGQKYKVSWNYDDLVAQGGTGDIHIVRAVPRQF